MNERDTYQSRLAEYLAGRMPAEEELRAHGRHRLEAHKVPERVLRIEQPPLGRTGKTDRAAAARIAADAALGGAA